MGGSGTSVLYTEANSVVEKTDGTYVIPTATLVDQGYMPRAEDLIINSDGRFFKVARADENSIIAYLLAVSGNGTGGSTPGGPDDDGKSIDVTKGIGKTPVTDTSAINTFKTNGVSSGLKGLG
jgi:hypothetical protein